MKRWWIAFALAVLACLPIWLARPSSPTLLEDSDTAVLLSAIRERSAPLSWFTSDWPLENHFYRPMSTLVFEVDSRLNGDDPAGYGRTQALLLIGCVLALFWFVRELTDRPAYAALASGLMVLWQFDRGPIVGSWLGWAAIGLAALAFGRRLLLHLREGSSPIGWTEIALASLSLALLGDQLVAYPLRHRTLDWLPGRTATTMTVFCLVSLAAFARFERTRPRSASLRPATPHDLPATRTTALASSSPRAWMFALIAGFSMLFALGSYEQAVMLPATLLAVTVIFRLQRPAVTEDRRVWFWHAAFWGLLVGYLLLRRAFLPEGVSGYQAQQFRDGMGVWMSLMRYGVPAGRAWVPIEATVRQPGLDLLFVPTLWAALVLVAGNVAGAVVVGGDRRWPTVAGAFALSFLAFLPMAWLKPFDHYHYWPLAMRTVFVVAFGAVVGSAALSAVSPPALRAPSRPDPAPGSLPRRSGSHPSS
ncbi:MAG TPA: hypothetical protein PLL78_08340 [Fimbriimonadaceae bacterium]|nr:hypothetical protein [Fimbriimonadaceae bacterium]HRJ96684.1 hypothetical protein [Fimbriimonadaceae bacterium]